MFYIAKIFSLTEGNLKKKKKKKKKKKNQIHMFSFFFYILSKKIFLFFFNYDILIEIMFWYASQKCWLN